MREQQNVFTFMVMVSDPTPNTSCTGIELVVADSIMPHQMPLCSVCMISRGLFMDALYVESRGP